MGYEGIPRDDGQRQAEVWSLHECSTEHPPLPRFRCTKGGWDSGSGKTPYSVARWTRSAGACAACHPAWRHSLNRSPCAGLVQDLKTLVTFAPCALRLIRLRKLGRSGSARGEGR
jgi:hypothetical protein